MAVLSGNTLLPLMYYSFRPESVHLWSIFCKFKGVGAIYEIKRKLYEALLMRDVPNAQSQTDDIMERAITDLSVYCV